MAPGRKKETQLLNTLWMGTLDKVSAENDQWVFLDEELKFHKHVSKSNQIM